VRLGACTRYRYGKHVFGARAVASCPPFARPLRRNPLVPVATVDARAELNARLERAAAADDGGRIEDRVPNVGHSTMEAPLLRPLPAEVFDDGPRLTPRVDRYTVGFGPRWGGAVVAVGARVVAGVVVGAGAVVTVAVTAGGGLPVLVAGGARVAAAVVVGGVLASPVRPGGVVACRVVAGRVPTAAVDTGDTGAPSAVPVAGGWPSAVLGAGAVVAGAVVAGAVVVAGGEGVARINPVSRTPAATTAAAGISSHRRRRRRLAVIGGPGRSRIGPVSVSTSVTSNPADERVSSPRVAATWVAGGRAAGSEWVIAVSSGAQPGAGRWGSLVDGVAARRRPRHRGRGRPPAR